MEDNNSNISTQEIAATEVYPGILKLPYNTCMPPVVLAEYGRNIQNLVDYCVALEDKQLRTQCAHGIAEIMTVLFPSLKKDPNDRKKIWDHINIMSNFRLDIDFPVDVISAEEANPTPGNIPYSHSRDILFRYYGKHIQDMVKVVAEMEPSEDRHSLIGVIANHMKKLMLAHNKEGVSDAKVLRDLCLMSEGKIDLLPGDVCLYDFQEVVSVNPNQKQKKQKKNANKN